MRRSPAPAAGGEITRIDWPLVLPDAWILNGPPAAASGVCYDSRKVTPNSLFVAVPGVQPPRSRDGHDFIEVALERGASVLLVQADRQAKWAPLAQDAKAAFLVVPDTRRALAQVAAAFYGHPARRLRTIGVTGTDGKTTTAHLIAAVLEAAGLSVGSLTSVAFKAGGEAELNATHMTTMESPEVQAMLAAMVEAGRRYAVIEASSHGLALHRVDECEFDVAVFTTFSSDHLDFHGTLEEYLAAKGRLFEMLDESIDKGLTKTAVVNADDPASGQLRSRTMARAISYGIDAPADVRAEDVRFHGLASFFTIATPTGRLEVTVPSPGCFSVYNALAATAVGRALEVPLETVRAALAGFGGVPGRMEIVDAGQAFQVVVDIASTPEALRRVLEVLRPLTPGQLIAVFGCAGERDHGRRFGMGRAAGELTDFAVLTNEDPRSEEPDAIVSDIAQGLAEAGRREGEDFVRVLDRRRALRHAFERAAAGDVVLLAGKGTEQSIVVGIEHIPWDERAVARELLSELYPQSQAKP